MAKAQDGPAPISEESIGYLEEVKKGKPRKFAMICKGTSVVSLVVYKKGNVEKRRKEAKESGNGQFYFGVVDGKGMDIRFVLARADGFESAPVKTSVLKGFLDEAAEFKCKPLFEIVDAAPFVLDEDDPLVARFRRLQEQALLACDAHPDSAAAISAICLQIGRHFDQDQAEEAAVKLSELETLLGGLAGAAPSASPSAAPPNAPPAPEAAPTLEAKLVEALKKLKPLLIKAIELHPNRKPELIALVGKAGEEIKNKLHNQAQTDILALGKLLKSLLAPAAPAVAEPTPVDNSSPQVQADEQAVCVSKLQAVEPLVAEALQKQLGDTSRMRTLLTYAREKLSAGDFANATKALDGLKRLVDSALSGAAGKETDSIKPGLVAQRKKFLQSRWQSAIKQMETEIENLRFVSPKDVSIPMILGVMSGLQRWLSDFTEELNSAILGTNQASDSDGSPLAQAKTAIQKFRLRIASDPLIRHLATAKSELGINIELEKVISNALDELDAQLTDK